MTTIADNLQRLRDEIHSLEHRCGRPAGSVTLIAVSKTQPAAAIRAAHEAGVRHVGENYVQEALDKQAQLDLPDLTWHFIGPIQSNKTRQIANHFQWVHSIDRLKVAQRLNDQRDPALPPLNVCIQVNVSGEASKSGVDPAATADLCGAVAQLPNLRLRGLMAIPAPESDPNRQRQVFDALAALQAELRTTLPGLDTLSMGMSQDYPAAIAAGATLIRIGTAVFGSRAG